MTHIDSMSRRDFSVYIYDMFKLKQKKYFTDCIEYHVAVVL